MSLKLPRCSHRSATALFQKCGVYYFRCLLPEPLGSEIAVSLSTRNYQQAEYLAEQLNIHFDRVVPTVSSTPQPRSILRTYLAEALEDDAHVRLRPPAGRPVCEPDRWCCGGADWPEGSLG